MSEVVDRWDWIVRLLDCGNGPDGGTSAGQPRNNDSRQGGCQSADQEDVKVKMRVTVSARQEETKAMKSAGQEEMKAMISAGQEEMKATISAGQEKMEVTVIALRSKFEEIINKQVEGVLESVNKRTMSLHEELDMANQGAWFDIQTTQTYSIILSRVGGYAWRK